MPTTFLELVQAGETIPESGGCYRLRPAPEDGYFPSGMIYEPPLHLPAFDELVSARVTTGDKHRDFFVMISPDWNPDAQSTEDKHDK
jgi:hypothetical protein